MLAADQGRECQPASALRVTHGKAGLFYATIEWHVTALSDRLYPLQCCTDPRHSLPISSFRFLSHEFEEWNPKTRKSECERVGFSQVGEKKRHLSQGKRGGPKSRLLLEYANLEVSIALGSTLLVHMCINQVLEKYQCCWLAL